MKTSKLFCLIGLLTFNVFANDLPTDGEFQLNYPDGKPYLTGELKNDNKQD